MTTICITIIICITLICATRIYPIWIEHDRKKVEKAMKIVQNVREENNRLRKELNDHISEYVDEFQKQQSILSEVFDKLDTITNKLKHIRYEQ